MEPGENKRPWVWTAPDIGARTDWQYTFTSSALTEIAGALESSKRTGKRAGARLDALEREHFPLPKLSAALANIAACLSDGPGIGLLRGLPLTRYERTDIERIFCGIGTYLGTSVSQSARGDRLGRVMDIGEPGRYYTVGGALEMHMDPTDIVGLLCLRKAVSGGESRVASAVAVHDTIGAERPDLLRCLTTGFYYSSASRDRVAGDVAVSPERIPVFSEVGGTVACFYLPISVRTAERHGKTLSSIEHDALAIVDEIASRPSHCLEMDLQPGDIQLLNNRRILHGRNDYTDASSMDEKREMLRLWLMASEWPPRPDRWNFHGVADRAAGGIPAGTR